MLRSSLRAAARCRRGERESRGRPRAARRPARRPRRISRRERARGCRRGTGSITRAQLADAAREGALEALLRTAAQDRYDEGYERADGALRARWQRSAGSFARLADVFGDPAARQGLAAEIGRAIAAWLARVELATVFTDADAARAGAYLVRELAVASPRFATSAQASQIVALLHAELAQRNARGSFDEDLAAVAVAPAPRRWRSRARGLTASWAQAGARARGAGGGRDAGDAAARARGVVGADRGDGHRPGRPSSAHSRWPARAEKVVSALTPAELDAVIDDHYENESQTLITAAEELLKLAELRGTLAGDRAARWADIKAEYVRQRRVGGAQADPVTRLAGTIEHALETSIGSLVGGLVGGLAGELSAGLDRQLTPRLDALIELLRRTPPPAAPAAANKVIDAEKLLAQVRRLEQALAPVIGAASTQREGDTVLANKMVQIIELYEQLDARLDQGHGGHDR